MLCCGHKETCRRQVKSHSLICRAAIVTIPIAAPLLVKITLDTDALRRFEDVDRAVDVDKIQLDVAGPPVIEDGRDVEDPLAAVHRRVKRSRIGHVADGVFNGQAFEQLE